MPSLLVVDDEPGVRESLRMLFKGDCEVATASTVEEAEQFLQGSNPDLILLDLVMPGRGGLDLLASLADEVDPPPVVVLTATKTVATAVEAMKHGAIDYITKPFEVDALRIKVRKLLERRDLEREVVRLRAEVDGQGRLGGLVGASPLMRELFQTIRRVANSRATVLIQAESGTGKELVSRAIHDLGDRADRPFVAVNCAAIPEHLIESELFGHERGAFTDARERRIGKFETASSGTLFLDEIGELGISVQAKLLRALQEKQIERLGGSSTISIDVRVIAATNRNLEEDVSKGRFRADLFYRINVVPIELPSLAERREDVRRLAEHFLAAARKAANRGPSKIARDAIASLERYPWPGNVRELENAIERAVALAEGDVLEIGDLPPAIVRAGELETLGDSVRSGKLGFEAAVANFEKTLLLEALARADGNQTRAAEQLQITRRSLKLKMDRHDI
ncbi:MAG: sigma-54-dependent Fis family transcriptional regulator [Deltaproteobacteria bacterium]|nr:sigma-54-dependent Fis family transcriptional regulator [Deltaproteobacteria bacterium]